MPSGNHPNHATLEWPHNAIIILKLVVVATLYALTAKLALSYFAPDGSASVFFIASGVALAAVIIGGYRYLWAILIGAIARNLWQGKPLIATLVISTGSTCGSWLGAWLIAQLKYFNPALQSLRDYCIA